MSRVENWVWDFFDRHIQRHPRLDWPDPTSEFWQGFRLAILNHGVIETVADEASLAMMQRPAAFLDGVVSAFLAEVKLVWTKSETVAPGANDREDAMLATLAMFGGRPCDDCGNQGFAVRYRHQSLVLLDKNGRAVAPSVTFYCRCPMGRWIERRHREGNEESRSVRKRIPDLVEHPALWGEEFRSPPMTERHAAMTTAAMLKGLVESTRAESARPRDKRPTGSAEIAFSMTLTPAERLKFDVATPRERAEWMARVPEPQPPSTP